MDKRYQVFVSSTYSDLLEERQEIMQALLELDCIPAGMELFPAANDDQWTLIKRVIDDCDYYLVVIGGRYGSLGPQGLSYTEMEYRYAVAQGKPVIAFLHKDPGTLPVNRTEDSPEGRAKLQEFRKLAQQKMVKYWTTPTDLGSVVSRSIVNAIKSNPAIGWVRADKVPDENTTEELLRLRKQVEELQEQLQAVRVQAPEGVQELAQGDDLFEIHYTFDACHPKKPWDGMSYSSLCHQSWDSIFAAIGPILMQEAKDTDIARALVALVESESEPELLKDEQFKGLQLQNFRLTTDDFQTIKVQLIALGLIGKSSRQRSVKDTGNYWSLTPYGEGTLTRLRAIRKPKYG